jgi:hypothetical protein
MIAVLVVTIDGTGETVHAKIDTLTGAWVKAWEVWDRVSQPMTDYTGVREGPEVVVRYSRQGE